MVNVHDLTLEEKASLTSGGDAWHFQAIERAGVPGYMLTDGPHGLRKENSEVAALDMKNTVPATCFPPSSRYVELVESRFGARSGRGHGRGVCAGRRSCYFGSGRKH